MRVAYSALPAAVTPHMFMRLCKECFLLDIHAILSVFLLFTHGYLYHQNCLRAGIRTQDLGVIKTLN
jgi:hypothetical protein